MIYDFYYISCFVSFRFVSFPIVNTNVSFEFITGSIIDRSTKETWQEDIIELKELTPLGYRREFEFFTRLREDLQIEGNENYEGLIYRECLLKY